jgi:hypothetical protein
LGANAEFEFQTTDLDNLKLKLSGGSAIFEVYADNEFKVTLDLPDADIELTKSGVYRVDVLADGSGKISVWKGKVLIGDEKLAVTAGKTVIVKGKTSAIAKFDRDNKDALDIWSDLRAKEASRINKRLQRNALTSTLLNSYSLGGWNMYNTFGLWVFDRLSGRWCFLPFGQGWRSPYGYGYGFNIYDCPLPPIVYTMPTLPAPTTTTTPGNPMTPQQAQIREERRQTVHTPTFQRFENNQRNETRGSSRSDGNSDSSSGNWNNNRDRSDSSDTRPTYTPSQPTQSTPAPSTPVIVNTPSPSESKTVKEVKDN